MKELYDTVLAKAKTAINGNVVSEETRALVDMAVKLHGCLFPITAPASVMVPDEAPESKPEKQLRKRTTCKRALTDEELLSMEKVTPEIAAAYLQSGTNAHYLRLDAQNGDCPFMQAIRNKGRYSYRVNVGLLIKYKHGELGII